MNRTSRENGGTWLVGGAAAMCLAGVVMVLVLLASAGIAPFWPSRIVDLRLGDGREVFGEIVSEASKWIVVRQSELDRAGGNYVRIARGSIADRSEPADAFAVALTDGRRLFGRGDSAVAASALGDASAPARIEETLWPNSLGYLGSLGVLVRHAGRFLFTSNAASTLVGGALPALVGTVTLVLLMSLIVMPFGVATAVYLHERRGFAVGLVRSAIGNLAGVPSIVYGVLGLGLFVHGLGAGIDRWFFSDRLPVPTFGSGGLLWAALSLALLTLPVVVVSVEEGLARIPPGLRTGSLALGATHGETMWRLLLPAARPALLTGFILAIARAAGAVAPLMLVGVVKLAPALPVDGEFPFLHPSRQFMHLGFSVYDAALASPDALRGVPRAYACALLLVIVVIALNLAAIVLRNRLRERYREIEA
ncbi:MAG TPA: ABC transporter permease subunit [Rhodanobacteraceae bacterium]|jgi:phosphate transport system permease protein|nr:ABC transporter permease subunit [Rhodanobacteraceae bacterium]